MSSINTLESSSAAFYDAWKLNATWTLFLDRDGVINRRLIDEYVRFVDEFEFIPGVLQGLAKINFFFKYFIIVTNQQGIGKKLMSVDDLQHIHKYMMEEIEKNGGRIDEIYFSPHLKEEKNSTRKPGINMALEAKNDFPELHFDRSIMVGDSESDMIFGRKVGMKNVFIGSPEESGIEDNLYDLSFFTLADFSQDLEEYFNRKKTKL